MSFRPSLMIHRRARGGARLGGIALAMALLACGRPSAPVPDAAGTPNAPFQIVTSFYPMYIMAINITEDIPGVTVANLTGPTTGCLHDFQLTPEAMRGLAGASVLVVNGGGMETFLDKIVAQYPTLSIIEASQGIEMITAHGEANPHIWVSVTGAIQQVRIITNGLAAADPERADRYRANAKRYVEKLEALRAEMHAAIDPLSTRRIVTFHEAFPWFAREFGLEIVAIIEQEPGAEPGAGELAGIIRLVREKNVRVIFSEPQYSSRAAETIARETNARVYPLDPAVTGPKRPDAYLEIMRANLAVLRKALAS